MATTSLPGAVYLDACVLIDYVKGEQRAETIRSTLAHIDKGSITLVSSTLMLTEVLPAHADDGDKHRAVRDAVRSLLVSPRTRLVDVDQAVAQRAADLRLAHRLKTPDAIHLATALIAGAQVMFTE